MLAQSTPFRHGQRRSGSGQRGRQRGSAIIFVLFILLGLVGVGVMTIGLGQAYLARDQLQVTADASSRSAVIALKSGRNPLFAKALARFVGRGTEALERPTVLVDEDVQFGDWNHATETFTLRGTTHSPAVRVTARRTTGSFGGPIDMILGNLFGPGSIELQRTSIASTGCREVVFAIDSSEAMLQEKNMAHQLLQDFMNRMDVVTRAGDKIGVVTYAADDLSVVSYASNGGAFWSRPVPNELSAIPAEQADINAWVSSMNSEGLYCGTLSRTPDIKGVVPTLGRGSCLGKGDHWGIRRAIEMFDDMQNRCSSPGERVIVLVTGDIPCAWSGRWIGDRTTPYYGGTLADSYAAADEAWAAGIHVLPILLNRGNRGHCPRDPRHMWQHTDTPTEFIHKMARGFPTQNGTNSTPGLINPSQGQLNDVLDSINEILFVRLVD